MRRRQVLGLLGIGGALSLAAACASALPATAPSGTTQPSHGGSLRLGIPSEITGLDGHLIAAPATNTLWQVFDRLTVYNARLEPQPMLAESWSVNSDGTQLTLNLRKGVQFHSGRQFTSADVAWNLERVKDPKVGAGILAGYRRPLTGVETPDASTVVLKSDRPWPAAFDFFQLFNIVDSETMNGSNPGQTVGGTGPFMLIEWVQGDHITLKRNPNYWQSGKPYLDEIQATVSPDAQANLVRFQAGATDVSDSPPLLDTVRLQKDPTVDVHVSQNPSVFLSFFFNATRPPFDRKEIRRRWRMRSIDSAWLIPSCKGSPSLRHCPGPPARRPMTPQRTSRTLSIRSAHGRCSPPPALQTSSSRSCTAPLVPST